MFIPLYIYVCMCVCASMCVCMCVCVCEQVLEATPHKAAAIRPSTTRHENSQS